MELLNPSIGIIFWTLLSFLIVVGLLSKFAWKPISQALKNREDYINESLKKAKEIDESLRNTQLRNETLLEKAEAERKTMIQEAKQIYDQILSSSKEDAHKESERILQEAMRAISKEKEAMMASAKEELADLALSMVEKILEEKMKNSAEDKKLVQKLIKQLPSA